MNTFRFYCRLVQITLGQLCRKKGLLAVLLVLCFLLPMAIVPAVDDIFSRGISFSGITLGITAPEGDPVPALLEEFLPSMEDVSAYCNVVALEYSEAVTQLEKGSVTAVLVLPENFVDGILYGSNPDVDLLVSADHPLESLLTLWIGQSAADLLAAFQSGIYEVLALYEENPPEGLSYSQVVSQINLRYINWTMNRQDMFRVQQVPITGQLPVGLHYGLSLFCFLILSLTPVFYSIYQPGWIGSYKRFLSVGKSRFLFWIATVTTSWFVLFAIFVPALIFSARDHLLVCLAAATIGSLFCSSLIGVFCLLSSNLGMCGLISSLFSLLLLVVSGGVLPPVLLPQQLRSLLPASPITWLRDLFSLGFGYGKLEWSNIQLLCIGSAVLLAIGFFLYRQRFQREVNRK